MSDTTTTLESYDSGSDIRPLSVRMTNGTRAQLDIIAQLNNRSVTEEVREAIEAWLELSKKDPKVLAPAATVKAEIEREAATKRGAIAAIFDPAPTDKPAKQSAPTQVRPPKETAAKHQRRPSSHFGGRGRPAISFRSN